MSNKASVLLVDFSGAIDNLSSCLQQDVDLYYANDSQSAESTLKNEWIQVLVCNVQNEQVLFELKPILAKWPEIKKIFICQSNFEAIHQQLNSLQNIEITEKSTNKQLKDNYNNSAVTCLKNTISPEEFKTIVLLNVDLFNLARENQQLTTELNIKPKTYSDEVAQQRGFLQTQSEWEQGIVRSSDSSMNQVCEMIELVGPYDVNVVFTGESGTGKELCSKAIHLNSLRRHSPFIAENCGALPDELLASELFGHKKGAFTGATSDYTGLFEQANGGTLFLDEVGELSPNFQVKLLRVLQEGEIRPLGSHQYIPIDVRVIAATNRDLVKEVESGRFREDLYYRLATFVIDLPALRERQNDIVTISHVLLEDSMNLLKKRVKGFHQDTLKAMKQYRWPGNIRELQNEIKRMLVLCSDDYLMPSLLSANIQMQSCFKYQPHVPRFISIESDIKLPNLDDSVEDELLKSGSLKDRVESLEAKIIKDTLLRHRWNKSRAANELGLSRVGLRSKLERYDLNENEPEKTTTKSLGSSNVSSKQRKQKTNRNLKA